MFNIPHNAFVAMIVVLVMLVIASISRLLLKPKLTHHTNLELKQRITSWWWIIGLLFSFLTLGTNAAIVFFAFLSFLALKEFLSIVPIRQTDRNAVFWVYLSIPFQYYWIAIGWYGMFIIFIPVYIFLLIPVRMVLKGETDGFIKAAGIIHWAAMMTVFSISHIAYLLVLPEKNPLAGGIGLVLFLLFMTQFNDISQYIWGKLFGQHKIIPQVSPNKTWEGFLGGVISITLISALVAPYLTPLNVYEGLLAGLIISVSGFFGDVVISSVKRDLRIKDSGHLIPGHGGILDRMDSLIYTAPLFFHYLYYLHY